MRRHHPAGIGTMGGSAAAATVTISGDLILMLDTDATDSSANAHTVTLNGGLAVTAGAAFIGAGGLRFDGTNDYASVPAHASLACWAGDFLLEMMIKPDAYDGDYQQIVSQYTDANNYWSIYIDNTGTRRVVTLGITVAGVGVLTLAMGALLTASEWQHLALARHGSTVVIYRNHEVVASGTYAGTPTFTGALELGRFPTGVNWFDGDLDEVFIVTGESVWDAGNSYGLLSRIVL